MVKRKTRYDCVVRCLLNDTASTSGAVKRLMKLTNCTQDRAEEGAGNILAAHFICYFRAQKCHKTRLMIQWFSIRASRLHVGFEALTAVIIKSSIFCDFASCSPLKVNLRFGGTCRLHLKFEE
jgi:hypothetical protein